MRRNLIKLFAVGAFCLSFYGYGQQKPIIGRVVDSEGIPVQDAYIYIEGSNEGVYADENGNYTIQAAPGDVIKIEFIGLDSQSIVVGDKSKYNVKLKKGDGAVGLDDLVVVGYGNARDVASVASNVAVVSGESIAKRPSANALDALQGQVSGLQIFTSSGEPSANSSIRLHGIGSISAGNSPLFIVDGMQVGSDVLSSLNDADIENISVLKDASATSIYGSRAANGVIYITTKRGKTGTGVFTIDVQQGFSSLANTKFFDGLMNADELAKFWVETGFKTAQEMETFRKKYPYDTKWSKVYYKDYAPTTKLATSFSGGADKIRYYISGSYLNQDGVAFRSGMKRYTLRTNIDSKLNHWMKIGANIGMMYSKYNSNGWGKNSTNRGLFFLAQPFYSPVDKEGVPYKKIPGWNRYSPQYLAEAFPSDSRNAEINPSGFVEINPFKNLTFRSQGGIYLTLNKAENHRMPSYLGSLNDGTSSVSDFNSIRKSITNTVEYSFKLKDVHSFDVLAGQEYTDYLSESLKGEAGGFTNDNLILLGQGTKNKDVGQGKSEYAYSSFFGRLEYDYNKKYFFNASIRRDGSSRFGADNRFANFWSTGVMWKAKKESFLADVEWLSDLTFKASIGTSGNSDILDSNGYQLNYASLSLIGSNQYVGEPGYVLSNPGNPSLAWEKQTLTTLTANVGLFDRLNLELSVYDRRTSNLLYNVPIPYTTGFSEYLANVGTMQNQGIDIKFDTKIARTKDFFLNSYVNFNYNKDKITELFQGRKYWIIPNTGVGYAVGESIAFLYPIFKGVNPTTGLPEWYLPNENPEDIMNTRKDDNAVTTKFDKSLEQNTGIKRYTPITGGFGLSSGYKGFSLQADFSYALGKHLINNDRFFAENPNTFAGFNQSRVVSDYWKQPGDHTRFPKYDVQFTQFDSRLIEDASFLRLKNVTLSYTLPKKELLDQIKFIDNVKVYAIARNLLTITKYSGSDPEVDSNLSIGSYPNTKQFVFGVELKF
ncbi:SusC/RagA family TonB-linked outer membrane protein [Ornithobacterium rhinotracheale]|uniref:SusC/RagA family TonB-linked outer membrane protein n=1 Tax=Ornithobacterium rhinotracheale TaxID=28251 RepID=UPI00129C252C|nr:SusC/RagA family TonB-linked outer membrane protein [Ornithobacterium rhinotracheale]MRJ09598.1 SusC/RagA family TonB-linked outer membrane protein [Ornithobacterium rhinotracheale]